MFKRRFAHNFIINLTRLQSKRIIFTILMDLYYIYIYEPFLKLWGNLFRLSDLKRRKSHMNDSRRFTFFQVVIRQIKELYTLLVT